MKYPKFYGLILFLCCGLFFWQINIYRKTLIDYLTVSSIVFVIGLISGFILLKFRKDKPNSIANYVFNFVESTILFGFSIIFIIMYCNYTFKENSITQKEYKIIGSGAKTITLSYGKHNSFARKSKIAFEIDLNGSKKEIIWKENIPNLNSKFKVIEFDIQKGFFGFDVIVNQRIK